MKTWLITIKNYINDLDLFDSNSPNVLEHIQLKIYEVNLYFLSKLFKVSELHSNNLIILKQYFLVLNNKINYLLNLWLIDETFIKKLNQQTDSIYLYHFLEDSIEDLEELLKTDALSVKHIFSKISISISNLIGENILNPNKRNALSTFYHKKLEAMLKKIIQVIFIWHLDIFLGHSTNNFFWNEGTSKFVF